MIRFRFRKRAIPCRARYNRGLSQFSRLDGFYLGKTLCRRENGTVPLAPLVNGYREGILWTLGSTKDPLAFEVLKKELYDNPEPSGAIKGLASLGDPRSIALLMSAMKAGRGGSVDDRLANCRMPAAMALVNTANEEAIDAVYEEFKESEKVHKGSGKERGEWDKDERTRTERNEERFRSRVVDAFAASADPNAHLRLIDILESDNPNIRQEATRELSGIVEMENHLDIASHEKTPVLAMRDDKVRQAVKKIVANKNERAITREYAKKALSTEKIMHGI